MDQAFLVIKESIIHGKGLFTKKAFLKSEMVCSSDLRLLPQTSVLEVESWNLEMRKAFLEYAFQGGDNFYYGDHSAFISDPSFTMNHSCNPNCAHKTDADIIALRKIMPHEELTIDYATIMSPKGLEEPFSCNCGSKGCRMKVTRYDCLLPEIQRKYWPYFLSFIYDSIKIID